MPVRTPFQSGLFQLPFAFIMMSVAPRVPRLVARWGAAKVVPIGLLFTASAPFVSPPWDEDASVSEAPALVD